MSRPFLEIEHQAGVLDRLPGRFEQQPMLRIHVGRFARRDAKKLRIKLVDLIQKPAALREDFPAIPGSGIVEPLDIPSIGRHIADRLAPLDQQFPERFGVIDAAGKAAADSDDGDAVFVHKERSEDTRS